MCEKYFDPKEADMKYCGIDLHSNNSVVIVSDEEDRIVFSKRLPNDLGQIGAALEAHGEDLAGVVIESTYNWYIAGGRTDGYRLPGAFSAPERDQEVRGA
jgi:transposase